MATRNSSRSARRRARTDGNRPRTHPSAGKAGSGIPPAVEELISRERRRLQKALSVLTCLKAAADYEAEVDLGDAAAAAADLVDQVITSLDLIELDKRMRARSATVPSAELTL
jgi:hypothetical protein